jgi:hypothetical protein
MERHEVDYIKKKFDVNSPAGSRSYKSGWKQQEKVEEYIKNLS